MAAQLIGKYEIVRELGRGSMGIVYEARDTSSGKAVALKILSIATGIDGNTRQQIVERFRREARIAQQLIHPNIASIYDDGDDKGKFYIAMELCTGTTLRNFLKFEKQMNPAKVKDIAMQLLSALAVAHEEGIYHRDIKPDNIVIGKDGRVKLMDFGIAKMSTEATMTQAGQIMGSPAYMPPEQILGGEIDARSDLFSAGVVLYECLTGNKPFAGDSVTAITHSIIYNEPSPITGVSDSWAAIIAKSLQKDPAKRYQAANDMLNDISMGKVPVVEKPQVPVTSNIPNMPNTGEQTMMAPGPVSSTPRAPWEQSAPPYGAPTPPVQQPPTYNYGITPGRGYDPNIISINVPHPTNPWKRLVAWIVDWFILYMVFILIGVLFMPSILSGGPLAMNRAAHSIDAIIFLGASAYFIIMNGLLGQTVGKMAMSIRIVKYDNSDFTFGNALVRYALQFILHTVTLGLIYIMIFTNLENRGLHDTIAGTIVVDA